MLQTYQGYFDSGQFISLDNLSIPEKKRAIITILDDEIDVKRLNIIPKQQLKAFEEFFAAIDSIEGEPLTDTDFAELENNRLNFRRDLDL
ncbi:MAG: hypothetical protein FWG36_10070 [Oscillospiraceae bacterium]|nr:hypothetical protein [Oscillospiraceae bacterium]